jgi:hypothetical protein
MAEEMQGSAAESRRETTWIEDSRRQNEVRNVSVPLGDGGEKKFNWASELST